MAKNSIKQDEQLSVKGKGETILRLLRYLLKYKAVIAAVLVIMACTTIIAIINPLLIEQAVHDAARLGFAEIHCATDHCGYYEHFGFEFTGTGWHPWGETSRIYSRPTTTGKE